MYQRHSETSISAYEEILERADTLRAKVYRYLRASEDGATDDEVQVALAMNPSTQRPRRIELQRMGIVRDSGRTRKTRAGREAVVWIVLRQSAKKTVQGTLFRKETP